MLIDTKKYATFIFDDNLNKTCMITIIRAFISLLFHIFHITKCDAEDGELSQQMLSLFLELSREMEMALTSKWQAVVGDEYDVVVSIQC